MDKLWKKQELEKLCLIEINLWVVKLTSVIKIKIELIAFEKIFA